MKFIYDINPIPASRPRVTRFATYYGKKYTQFRKEMDILVKPLPEPLKCLLSVNIIFYIQIPKSYTKKRKRAIMGQHCDNNADIDNYLKALFDCFNRKIFEDDKQIAHVEALKVWSDKGQIALTIKKL